MPRGEKLPQIRTDLRQREIAHGAGQLGELPAGDPVREGIFIRADEKNKLVLRKGRAFIPDALDALVDVRRVQQPVPQHFEDLRRMSERHAIGIAFFDTFQNKFFQRAFVHRVRCAEADLPHAALDGGEAGVLHFGDAARVFVKGLALFGERDVARFPPQKAHARLPFQLRNAVGDGGLRDEKVFGDPREIFEFYEQKKGAQIFRIHNLFYR